MSELRAKVAEHCLSAEELVESLEAWLTEQDGSVYAKELAEAWNWVAEKHFWTDRLKSYDFRSKPED